MTTYNPLSGPLNPLNGIDAGDLSAPVFADIDADGKIDLVVGNKSGTLDYHKNTGSATNPTYMEQLGSANPFDGIDVGSFSTPTFADIDGDGKLDLIVGDRNGALKFYQNTGSTTAPVYTAQSGAANPFNGVDTGTFGTPTFVDLDNDGKVDVVVGDFAGTFRYYKNTGTTTAPMYTEQFGPSDPFDGIDAGTRVSPAFVDVDVDGDLDFVVGASNGRLSYYENIGSAAAAVYTSKTGVDNPFDSINVTEASTPTFTDGDGDGDLDLVVGTKDGTLSYYENATSVPVADTVVTQTGGNLTITADTGGNSEDSLMLSEVGGILTISDMNKALSASGTATQAGNNVEVTVSTLTGPATVNLGNGTNTLVATGITTALNITGGTGYSIIKSGAGNDMINGGSGKSKIEGGAGADTLDGGSGGDDTVEYTSSAAGVRVNLNDASVDGGDATGDTISNFENVSGSAQNDILTGDNSKNIVRGRAGNDVIRGRNGNDRLYGDAGNDNINGGGGNDFIRGGAGSDTLNGGAGNDTIYYIASNAGVTVDLIAGTGAGGDAAGDTISNVSNINGSNFDDTLTGNGDVNKIVGYDGNDDIFGFGGRDKLTGGAGDDIITGGADADILAGGIGADSFVLNTLSDSLLRNRDKITDFSTGEDVIVVVGELMSSTVSQLGAAENFSQAAIREVLSEVDFLANTAATFSIGSRTFVAINDDTAGYSVVDDGVIDITGFTGSLGNLSVVEAL